MLFTKGVRSRSFIYLFTGWLIFTYFSIFHFLISWNIGRLLIYLFFSGRLADPHFFHFSFFSFLWYKEVAHLFILLPAALLALTYLFILLRANLPRCTYLCSLFIAWCRHDAYVFILSRRPGRPSFLISCISIIQKVTGGCLFTCFSQATPDFSHLFMYSSQEPHCYNRISSNWREMLI